MVPPRTTDFLTFIHGTTYYYFANAMASKSSNIPGQQHYAKLKHFSSGYLTEKGQVVGLWKAMVVCSVIYDASRSGHDNKGALTGALLKVYICTQCILSVFFLTVVRYIWYRGTGVAQRITVLTSSWLKFRGLLKSSCRPALV